MTSSRIEWLPLAVAGACACAVVVSSIVASTTREPDDSDVDEPKREGVLALIGNTPLLRIASLSDATGCTILGKLEFMNPGGSTKDRAVLRIVEEAERDGLIQVSLKVVL